ncbi:MAG: LysM peptidoglycan-binding domain-containing protein [Chloroflexi bacterium]|nr:LysM peptidoglycan-binding domain-containing protein [Chloroflexota bacterium]
MQQASQHPVSPSEASDTANPRRDPAERFSEPASQLIRPQRFVSKTAPGTAQRRVLASLKSYRSAAQREPKFRRLVPRLLVATFLIAALALFGIWSLNSGGDTKVASQVISGKTKPSATNSPAPTAAASEAGPAVTSAARSASSRGGRQRVPYVPAETQPSGTGQDAGTEVASTGMEWPGLTGLALQRAASSPLPVPVGATPATLSQVVTSTDLLEEQKVATTYTVQDGDTIWDIAAANGVSVDLILSANNIGPDDILPLGRELTIPIQGQSQPTASPTPEAQPTPSPTAQQQQTTKTYVVQPGDTIWSIAADNGVSVDALLAANSMSEDDILALGRELTIPTEVEAQPSVSPTQPASPTPTAQPSPTPAPQGGHDIKTYVVQPGDTLSGIAAANGVSVETILWANNLTEDAMLRVGQELIVPPTDGVIYTVQEGDTLQGIAQEFGVDAQTIADSVGVQRHSRSINDQRRHEVGDSRWQASGSGGIRAGGPVGTKP